MAIAIGNTGCNIIPLHPATTAVTMRCMAQTAQPVYFEDRAEFRGAQRFGLRVRGPSMNRHYPPGTTLDCVRFIGMSRPPRHGDHVIVYRRGPGDLVEATVKELVRSGDRWELWPRSDHPAHKSPLILEGAPDDDTNEDLRIVALVIGAYTRRP